MPEKLKIAELIARFLITNIVPFFLVFHLVMRRRKEQKGKQFSELALVADEIKVAGVLGYFIILSVYFLSIPVLEYIHADTGFNIALIEPDGVAVFLVAFVSYWLVVTSIYLKYKKKWAYWFLVVMFYLLLFHTFFEIIEIGTVCLIPFILFSYFLYRLRRPSLRQELAG